MSSKIKNSYRSLLWKRILAVSVTINLLLLLQFALGSRSEDDEYLGISGFAPTATQLVIQATQRAEIHEATEAAFTPFPIVEENELGETWLSELETELGFSHPVLEAVVDEYVESIIMAIHLANNNYYPMFPIPDSIVRDVVSITFEDIDYIAVETSYKLTVIDQYRTFIFRLENDVYELLFDGSEISSDYSNLQSMNEFKDNSAPRGFADRNGNGFPDISISFIKNGNPRHFMYLYEIGVDGELHDLMQDFDIRIQYFVDFEGDGIWEIQGVQEVYVPGEYTRYSGSHYVPRWFFWNGESYEAYPLFDEE